KVFFGGKWVGTFSGGTNGTPLVINFNQDATTLAVQAIARSITFSTTGGGGQRVIQYNAIDPVDEDDVQALPTSAWPVVYVVVPSAQPPIVGLPFTDNFTNVNGKLLPPAWTFPVPLGSFTIQNNKAQAGNAALNIASLFLGVPASDVAVS